MCTVQVHKLKLEFVFFPQLSIFKKKAYLPTHSKKFGSATANKEYFKHSLESPVLSVVVIIIQNAENLRVSGHCGQFNVHLLVDFIDAGEVLRGR
jgi:hypothetical protein